MLTAISQLARLRLFATGGARFADDQFFGGDGNRGSNGGRGSSGSGGSGGRGGVGGMGGRNSKSFNQGFQDSEEQRIKTIEQRQMVEQNNAYNITKSIRESQIDRVFVESATLSDEAIQHFVRALCNVARNEIQQVRCLIV